MKNKTTINIQKEIPFMNFHDSLLTGIEYSNKEIALLFDKGVHLANNYESVLKNAEIRCSLNNLNICLSTPHYLFNRRIDYIREIDYKKINSLISNHYNISCLEWFIYPSVSFDFSIRKDNQRTKSYLNISFVCNGEIDFFYT